MTTLNSFNAAAERNPVVNIFIKKNGVVLKALSFVSQTDGGFKMQGGKSETKSAQELCELLEKVAAANGATIEIQ